MRPTLLWSLLLLLGVFAAAAAAPPAPTVNGSRPTSCP
uniref:Interferon gamma receptor 2 n=1 Tax=Homo sapiens TaxID=9606 RepID=F8WE34_HUMAN